MWSLAGFSASVLQVEVEAGGDLQAFAEQRLGAELLLDLLADVGDEVRRLAAGRRLTRGRQLESAFAAAARCCLA